MPPTKEPEAVKDAAPTKGTKRNSTPKPVASADSGGGPNDPPPPNQ